ncbi:MAG: hypothetical protein SFW67_08030 [Myxococcaceae bacterium]|nr:hypothetical protein [Myxococcaceae bacterium]
MVRWASVLVMVGALPVLAAAPTVTTNSATSVQATQAVLNATGNPGSEATTGWFRHDTVSPGTCNDTFGTRVPATSGTSLGSGSANVAYQITTTGLLPGTTYFFCAIVQNASGTAFGSLLSFTTPALAPTVFTQAATMVTSSTGVLNGSATPNGAPSTGYFRYWTFNPGSCFSGSGIRVPSSGGSALGSSNTSQNYSQTISGLTPGTQYWYCAFADNSQGSGNGVVLSFNTLVAAPVVTTSSASSVGSTSATLSGSGNPNGASTTGWFRIATSNPVTCNDAFGTRVPTASGTNLGAGTSAQFFSQSSTGLSPGTQYWFCAIAQNSEGTSFGAVQTFTTPAAPTLTTDAETLLTATSARLNGTGTPNLSSTTAWFRYSTVNPGVCDDFFGFRVPSSSFSNASLGAGTTPQPYAFDVSGLVPGTTYYFCAIAQNGVGTTFGGVRSFTTPAAAPLVSTGSVTSLTGTTLTFNGSANPRGATATAYFRYSTTSPGSCNDTFGTRAPASGGTNLGAGNTSVAFAENVTGLSRGTTYFFCAIATNAVGTSFGSLSSITTPNVPTVTTSTVSSLTNTSAILNGSVNPNGANATAYFRYSTSNPGTCNDTFGTRAPTTGGTSITFNSSYTQTITGLTPLTQYFYCAIATNAEGTGFGTVQMFTTPDLPSMVTNAASSVTTSSAVLNGSGNPNLSSASGWFRYSTVSPGTCNDSFGTRLPSFSSTSLGFGNTPVPYSQTVTGLLPGVTYFYCAIGSNGVGTSVGAVQSFTTLPAIPSVGTGSATLVTGTTATLNGTANPGGAATTAFFRYSTTNPVTCNDTFGTRAPTMAGTALAAGNTTSSFSEAISGLTPGTTYFYCALATNSAGTGFGSVLSFTTPNTPTVTTFAPSSVTGTSASFNGQANPLGASAIGYFRYGVTDPGVCNDSYGTRAPVSSGTALGGGFSAVGFSTSVTGLSPGTTYYVCALASNSVGVGVGAALTFTTPASPAVTTLPATSVTATSGTLNATGIPNGSAATGWFRYSTTNPGTCDDTFGTRAPSFGGTTLGSGMSTASFSVTPAGLLPGTTYYYCALASNSVGTGVGSVLSFTTPALPPLVTSASTNFISDTGATLNGSATPRGDATTAWFRFSATNPGTCNDTFGTRSPATGGTNVGAGNAAQAFTQVLTGLTPSTTYYWCAIAQNGQGTSLGAVVSFTTVALPTVLTQAASPVTSTSATLNSSITANGTSTTAWFRFANTNPGACNDTFGTRTPTSSGTNIGAGLSPVTDARSIAGLLPGNQYWFCAIASNTIGTQLGALLSFTTPPQVPTVTTTAPTSLTATTGTLTGSANPNGAAATAWFRYSTASPGVCNDGFGTRVPATGGTAIPFGNSPVNFTENVTGLAAGTTYYVCAISQNSVGIAYGSVFTFTTPGVPTANTVLASSITSSGALLNGTGVPNRADATGWFRYSTTNPGTCNDTFGTRAPATGGDALGNGTSAVSYSESITGLSAGTTYFYCAIVSNVVGTAFGTVQQFTTLNAPTVTTGMASSVTASSATLNATANPNNASSTGWFRYYTVDPGTCVDSGGVRAPTSGGTALGAGTMAVPYTAATGFLSAGTTYWVCAFASNTAGTSVGLPVSFVTPGPPTVTTSAVTTFDSNSATFEATVNPNLGATTAWFRYTTSFISSCTDTFGTRVPLAGISVGAGSMVQPVSQPVTGLASATTYYYCAIAQNSAGTRFGTVRTFTTTAAPFVSTSAATSVTATTATLNGSVNPRGQAATGWFRYATTSPGTCNDIFGTRAPVMAIALGSGSTSVALSEPLTGLTAGTTYYYCAIAENAVGTGFGSVLSFTTPGAPTVVTNAASSVLGSTATLNGSATPNLSASTGWFRYATTNPGTCDDTFGTRAPATGGTSLGSGTAPVAFTQFLSGLASSTQYWFCAIAQNAEGTRFGSIQTFTTLAAPVVTTNPPTSVTASTAIFNGSGNPNGATSTGYFRLYTTNPGTCADSGGTRVPFSGGSALGSGTTAQPFSQTFSGLTSGTSYWVCAFASSAVGVGAGTPVTFDTPGAPAVATLAATGVSSSVATLNGTATPRGSDTTGYFRFSTINPGSCNTSFGARAPVSGGTLVPSGSTATPFTASLSGLSPNTTYFFCAIAQNAVGTTLGSVLSFTTPTGPTVTTGSASAVTSTSATLNGAVNPLGDATTAWFRFSAVNPGACNDTFGSRAPVTAISVGSGTSAQPISTALSGLSAGTTYYFCVIAQNGNGTGLGSVGTFFTPGAPTVTTTAASNVTATGALVGATINANADATTAWVRYGTTSPGACNDTFGTRFPATGGTAMGSSTTAQTFTSNLSGLTGGTTYFYCVVAQNGVGTSFGAVLSFTTLAAPAVTTIAASSVSSNGATLNGSGVAFGAATTGWFRYATTSPGTCNDTFGTRAPTSGGSALGTGGTAQPFAQAVTGLSPGVTYFFCAIAQNSVATTFGAVLQFTTGAAPPSATTLPAAMVTGGSATLNGSGLANGTASTGFFRYGVTNPGSCTDTFGTRAPATGGTPIPVGATATSFSEALMGLMPGTTYFACAGATSSAGTTFGAVVTFTTPRTPTVTTGTGQPTSGTQATLSGTVAASGGADGVAYVRYGTTNPGTCNDTFGTRFPAIGGATFPAGAMNQPFSHVVTGLTPGTRYFFCAAASNVVGVAFGSVQGFTTPGAPVVTTSSASLTNGPMPRLNGVVNPTGAPTVAWFRIATADPGACNDTFGRRVPAAGGTSVPAGTNDVNFGEVAAGLEPGRTHWFCAIAENPLGKRFGQVLQFNSFAPAPIVRTGDAIDVEATSATLRGSVNPNGTAATGWFRISETRPMACDDSFGTRVPTMDGVALGDGAEVPLSLAAMGLKSSTRYFVCAIASNLGGAAFGDVREFTTKPAPPSVKTIAATQQPDGSFLLTGTVNPQGLTTSASFKYSTTRAQSCATLPNASRVPALGNTLAPGFTEVPQQELLKGLAPGEYFFCMFATSEAGEGNGEVQSFVVEGPMMMQGCSCTTGLEGTGASAVLALTLALGLRRRRVR